MWSLTWRCTDPPIQTAALAPTTLGAVGGSTNPGKAAAAYSRMAEAIEAEVNRDGGAVS